MMHRNHNSRIGRGAFAALVAATLSLAGLAEARAACKVPMEDSRIDSFLDDPKRSLLDDPRGSDGTIWLVRSMAVVNVETLRAIRQVIPMANRQQKDAIGEGFARAVGACDARDGGIARRITDAIRTAGDTDVTKAFLRFYSPPEPSTPAALPN